MIHSENESRPDCSSSICNNNNKRFRLNLFGIADIKVGWFDINIHVQRKDGKAKKAKTRHEMQIRLFWEAMLIATHITFSFFFFCTREHRLQFTCTAINVLGQHFNS